MICDVVEESLRIILSLNVTTFYKKSFCKINITNL